MIRAAPFEGQLAREMVARWQSRCSNRLCLHQGSMTSSETGRSTVVPASLCVISCTSVQMLHSACRFPALALSFISADTTVTARRASWFRLAGALSPVVARSAWRMSPVSPFQSDGHCFRTDRFLLQHVALG